MAKALIDRKLEAVMLGRANVRPAGFVLMTMAATAIAAPIQRDSTTSRNNSSAIDKDLYEAAGAGDITVMINLIRDGANVNATIPGDGSPLIVASAAGHLEVVELLLNRRSATSVATCTKHRTMRCRGGL